MVEGELVSERSVEIVCSAYEKFSPTEMVVVRSFSIPKCLHMKERNRMKGDKVRKIRFCRWNVTVMRGLDRLYKVSFWKALHDKMNKVDELEKKDGAVDEA